MTRPTTFITPARKILKCGQRIVRRIVNPSYRLCDFLSCRGNTLNSGNRLY